MLVLILVGGDTDQGGRDTGISFMASNYIMKISIVLAFFISIALTIFGQRTEPADHIAKFDSLLKSFKENSYYDNDTIKSELPLIYKGKSFNVVLSSNPLPISIRDTVLKNPFNNKYPLSYSVIFHNNLIALFEPGSFVCYSLPSLKRNVDLEKRLNTMKFEYHWFLENKLLAKSDGETYFLNADDIWEIYPDTNPLNKQPKLFEDEQYIAFSDCHGEWGGTVYFFNKKTQKIYFTAATCANTIFKRNGKYFVLSELGHMFGSTNLKEIENPDKLTNVSQRRISNSQTRNALGYSDSSKHAKMVFDFYRLQFFSTFLFGGRTLYLVYWRNRTFLAEITDSTISVVNPLFNNGLYTARPVTTSYIGKTLINLDDYNIAERSEVSIIVIEGNILTRVDWNEKHIY